MPIPPIPPIPPIDPLTTKGDLFTYSTDNTRIGIGSNDEVLTADSSEATGMKWAAASATSMIRNETPSGDLDSVDTTYTIANTPLTDSLRVYINGVRQQEGATEDYTLSGTTITFATAPDSGDIILADYEISSGTFAVGSTSFVINETPSGTIDGANAAFDTASNYVSGTTQLYRDGQLMKAGGADYTETDADTVTFTTAPTAGSVLLISYQSGTGTAGNADTLDNIHAVDYGSADGELQVERGGWKIINATLTYSSADDPTYVMTTSADLTDIISTGMRLRFTNDGGTVYGIVTAIDASTITMYGGTDYDVANSAITVPVYSEVKAPLGFPLDPTKWSVLVTDTSNRAQASPTQNVWYNLGSVAITVPIGIWEILYDVSLYATDTSATFVDVEVTLSTAADSESDANNTVFHSSNGASTTLVSNYGAIRHIDLNLAVKDVYYLNTRTTDSGIGSINNRGDRATTVIRARCAYL